ncbi:AfsR/SARP family transcriptional regulator [Plantibacter sp. Mn2098]|uniref:AfsR/SARP family transcriptional regulator n=1 Tax=Plantibacter sp. Mn2098 TaxID=3395266 RepID=UPI003BD1D151
MVTKPNPHHRTAASQTGGTAPNHEGAIVRVGVLGPVVAAGRDGTLLEPTGRLAQALIIALALAGPHGRSTSQLIDELWEEDPPAGARAALQTLVSRVRAALEPGLLTSTVSGYALSTAPDEIDLGIATGVAEHAASALRTGDARTAVDAASHALGLWRSEPGADLDSELGRHLANRAAVLHRDLTRIVVQGRLDLGEGAAVVTELELLAADAPLDDAIQLMLFNAYAQSGRRTEAMQLFAAYRTRLRDELGADPSGGLLAAHTALLRSADDAETATDARADAAARARTDADADAGITGPQTPRDIPQSAQTDHTPAALTTHAPIRIGIRTAPNELIGRDDDLVAIESLIAAARVTTILGPGGLGKTRVAQEIGRRAGADTSAVIFVGLASVQNAEDIPLAVATTLGIREVSARRIGDSLSAGVDVLDLRARILAKLSEQRTLLIVDNCEHLVDAAARWIADVLDWTTDVRILTTSRAPLTIAAEYVYQLDSLASTGATTTEPVASPAAGAQPTLETAGPAVRLFVERARAARPSAAVPLDVITRLCDRLDGLPLAIELAAARIRTMSVEEIERRLGNRFALLSRGERTAPERHRTLLAVIDWSWNLLGEQERIVLRRASRFPDGFGVEAADIVSNGGGDGPSTGSGTGGAVDGPSTGSGTGGAVDGPSTGSGTGGSGTRAEADVADALDALVGQSLVIVRDDTRTGLVRFRMLETVREFGAMMLAEAGEDALVQERFAQWAVQFSKRELPETQGPDQIAALARTRLEQDNLVSVLRWGIDAGRPDIVAPVFALLSYSWSVRSAHSEVLAFGEAVLDAVRGTVPDPDDVDSYSVCLAMIAATFVFTRRRTAARALGALRAINRTHPTSDARVQALITLLLASGRPDRGRSLLRSYQASDDPRVAGIANLLVSQFAENDGDPDTSQSSAERAWELAERIGDVWGAGMASHMLAQLNSQNARPEAALLWAERADSRLRALDAEEDLRQLEWVVALSNIARGEYDAAVDVFTRFLRDDVPVSDFAPIRERRSIGYSGLAEVARARGEGERAQELYDLAVDTFGVSRDRRSPWLLMVAGAAIVAGITDGTGDPMARAARVHELRVRVVATSRVSPSFIDKPVLGAAGFGIGVWAVRSADPAVARIGLELMALAERLNSRQDPPALHRDAQWDGARSVLGAPTVAAMRERVGGLSGDESAARTLELLGSRVLAAR